MKIYIHPEKDIYFTEGLKFFLADVVFSNNLMILNLSKWSLKEIVTSKLIGLEEIGFTIIITEQWLLPVANFLLQSKNNAFIINARNIKKNNFNIKDTILSKKNKPTRLTIAEYKSLECCCYLMSPDEEAYRYNKSKKTVYSTRSKVAHKLGVRKLSDILI